MAVSRRLRPQPSRAEGAAGDLAWERYLDHATTSAPKAPGVAERMADVLRGVCASPGRSSHAPAREAADLVRESRERIASFFECRDANHVVFTAGATAALNLALKGLLRPGDHVIATSFDHNSTLRPLARLRQSGVRVTIVRRHRPDDEFVAAVTREIRPQTRLVVVNHASNVLGCVLPYEAISDAARACGAFVLLDTAQTAGLVPINLGRTPVDLLVFSGHKALLGPPGVGGLIVHNTQLELTPQVDGGTGYLSEELEPGIAFPISFEAGTPNTPAIAALEIGVDYLAGAGSHTYRIAAAVRQRCVEQLRTLPHVELFDDPGGQYVPIVSFRIPGVSPHRVATILDSRFDIQVRAGLHCAPLMHQALGTEPTGGTVRASFGYGNTDRSADLLCEAVKTISEGV
jgi:cysteine desulfurase family protein